MREALANRDPEQYKSANDGYDAAVLNFVIDSLLLGKQGSADRGVGSAAFPSCSAALTPAYSDRFYPSQPAQFSGGLAVVELEVLLLAGCVDLGHGPTGMRVSSRKSLREIGDRPKNRRLRQPAYMKAKRRFANDILAAILDGKALHIRAGTVPHCFIGIWAMVVEGRVFVRWWRLKPRSWYRTFLEELRGARQNGGGLEWYNEQGICHASRISTPAGRLRFAGANSFDPGSE